MHRENQFANPHKFRTDTLDAELSKVWVWMIRDVFQVIYINA